MNRLIEEGYWYISTGYCRLGYALLLLLFFQNAQPIITPERLGRLKNNSVRMKRGVHLFEPEKLVGCLNKLYFLAKLVVLSQKSGHHFPVLSRTVKQKQTQN